jgi:hypothetical protein
MPIGIHSSCEHTDLIKYMVSILMIFSLSSINKLQQSDMFVPSLRSLAQALDPNIKTRVATPMHLLVEDQVPLPLPDSRATLVPLVLNETVLFVEPANILENPTSSL